MTKEQEKRDVKEEPTKAKEVKQEMSEDDLDGLSGGSRKEPWILKSETDEAGKRLAF